MCLKNFLKDFNDSSEDNKREIFKKFTELKLGDKSLKVEAYPGSGKTFLISKVIEYVDLQKEGYIVLSYMNSSISTLESNLKKNGIQNPKVQTLVSFFISYFLVPLGFKISKENGHLFTKNDEKFLKENYLDINNLKKINLDFENFIDKNLKINKNFGESDISENQEWLFIKQLIVYYLSQEKYLNYFISSLKSDGIKYIFIDEYQDTDIEYMDIIKEIIKKQEFIFYITGDINQSINYKKEINFSNISNFLEEIDIEIKTIPNRFKNNSEIFNLIKNLKENKFDIPNIHNFNSSISKIDFSYDDNYLRDEDKCKKYILEFIKHTSEVIKEFIDKNENILKGKNNVILTFLGTDYGIGRELIDGINKELSNIQNINILGAEKIIVDFRLTKFVEKLILFIQNKKNTYLEAEKELKFIVKSEKFDFNKFFLEIIKIDKNNFVKDLIEKLKNFIENDSLKKVYSDNNKFFDFLNILEKKFGEEKILDLNFEKSKLYDLFKDSEKDKINISINTIHSSKGKEYDNVIILELAKVSRDKDWIKNLIKNQKSNQYKNMYYVGLSRAKEKIFTFVDL